MPRQAADSSSDFRIFETQEFAKKLKKLPVGTSDFIQHKLRDYIYPQLRPDPFFGHNIRKLKGYDPATWRYRIGKFRVFYIVDPAERIVSTLSIDDRRDAYK